MRRSRPVENRTRNIWVTETGLSTALNVSFMASLVSLFGVVVGVALLLTGVGFVVLAAGALPKRASPTVREAPAPAQ